jgi:predicted NAD-dependent protein-ADP-ribosyltransferase YbiA (DUF1768 family)
MVYYMTILFYDAKEKYGEFSNFYEYPITMDGIEYPTTEHYYQCQKFVDYGEKGLEYAEIIRIQILQERPNTWLARHPGRLCCFLVRVFHR